MSDVTVPGDPQQWTGRRADARRNHEAVFAAACELFALHGLDATIPAIAERAGVGKATVYRSYPTKDDLVLAVAREQLRWYEELAARADAQDDALAALSELLGELAGRLAEDRLFAHVLSRAAEQPDARVSTSVIERIVTAGKQQGTLRADATATDVQVLVAGFSRVLIDRGVHDPAVWRRYASLVLDALRPPR